jgi:D-tyrosyl-tRNA(Tyr) deacylase
MKVLIQRVSHASVRVNDRISGQIGPGLVVFVGIGKDDSRDDACYLANKLSNLRIFACDGQEFALSALDINSEILIVSQFTLLADARKGRRPSFGEAAPPDKAKELYDFFIEHLRHTGLKIETGVFQEHMQVEIHNDGPVTLLLESK